MSSEDNEANGREEDEMNEDEELEEETEDESEEHVSEQITERERERERKIQNMEKRNARNGRRRQAESFVYARV